MKQISELRNILNGFFNWNNARLTCFTQMLLALFSVRSVNLREIAVGMESKTLIDSRYKRCKRFFPNLNLIIPCLRNGYFSCFFWKILKNII